jgi:hypothetical protein
LPAVARISRRIVSLNDTLLRLDRSFLRTAMNNSSTRLTLLLLSLLGVSGCGADKVSNSITTGKTAAVSAWPRFQHPTGIFSVAMPVAPRAQTRVVENETRTIYAANLNETCTVLAHNLPNAELIDISDSKSCQESLHEFALQTFAANKILNERPYVQQGIYPSLELRMEVAQPKGGIQRVRIVLLPKSTVMLMVVGRGDEIDLPEVKQCLDSLKIGALKK